MEYTGLDLVKIRKRFKWSQESLAELIGVSYKTILNYEKTGKVTKTKWIVLDKIIKEAEGKEADISNIGHKISNHSDQNIIDSTKNSKMLPEVPSEIKDVNYSVVEQSKGIPYYEVDVFAGNTSLFNDHKEAPTMYMNFPGFQDCDFACRVSGNSMEDQIHAGDIIACKEIKDRRILAYGDIHLIITPEHRFVKTLRKGSKAGAIILRSTNKEYDDIDIMIDDIFRLYLVKGIIKKTQI